MHVCHIKGTKNVGTEQDGKHEFGWDKEAEKKN